MTILDSILRQKRAELPGLPENADVQPAKRDFIAGLRSQSPCLIAEIKPKSPSAGALIAAEKIPAMVEAYNTRARAISVLCDATFFGGGFDLLERVRHLSDLPILAKEFIVDVKQIRAARHAGADAVLLIAAILDADTIRSLATEAIRLGMGVLLELHDEREMESIPNLDPGTLAIGINNRNLATLEIDLGTTERLAPLIRKRFPDHILLSESGVGSKSDLARLQPYVDGFLIGTGLLTGTMADAFPPHA